MPRLTTALLAAALMAALPSGFAFAQQVRMFDSQSAIDAEIAGHMAEGSFSALVDAVAPPAKMSSGRIRILEGELPEDFPPLLNNTPVFRSDAGGGISRAVTAWWDGEIYVYLGLLLHTREDGVAVLDFMLTGDIDRASRWFLTAE